VTCPQKEAADNEGLSTATREIDQNTSQVVQKGAHRIDRQVLDFDELQKAKGPAMLEKPSKMKFRRESWFWICRDQCRKISELIGRGDAVNESSGRKNSSHCDERNSTSVKMSHRGFVIWRAVCDD
jgi:hypothetical protein